MKGKAFLGLLIALVIAFSTAQAGTKEELVRLQEDVLALRNQILELDKSFSEKTDGLKSLVEQLNDQVAESTLAIEKALKFLESQSSGAQSADQALLQEIRTLSGKIDDMATRVTAMAQQMMELKVQSQSFSRQQLLPGGLSPDALYDQAYRDFVQGSFDLAIQGFNSYVQSYPGGNRAAAALCYIGDAYSIQKNQAQAIAAFTRVIDEYPDSDMVAVALYKRALAQLSLQERENAVADFKTVIIDFPDSPESLKAKEQLQNLGVRISKH
jgi:tol-pal system protein YbgF